MNADQKSLLCQLYMRPRFCTIRQKFAINPCINEGSAVLEYSGSGWSGEGKSHKEENQSAAERQSYLGFHMPFLFSVQPLGGLGDTPRAKGVSPRKFS